MSSDDSKGIDIGIVIRATVRRYGSTADTVGMKHSADVQALTGVMHRLEWGSSTVKLTRPDALPDHANPPGGFRTGTGIRYITLTVDDLDEMVARCHAAGYAQPVERTEVRPGVTIAVVEDPEGNWIEFLQA